MKLCAPTSSSPAAARQKCSRTAGMRATGLCSRDPCLWRGSSEAGARGLESGCPGLSPPLPLLLFQSMCLFGPPGLSCSSGLFVLCGGTWGSQFSCSSGVQSPDQRSNPSALHWARGVSAPGSPRTSRLCCFSLHVSRI